MSDRPDFRKYDFGERDVRFLGYNFLKNAAYGGEPVVPVIMSESVEVLGGQDLSNIILQKAPLVDKLKIFNHVIGQLQEIDGTGIVLFDRRARNIRVLSWGEKGISTRQMDIEYFYDKKTGAVYADDQDNQRHYERHISSRIEQHGDLWASSVRDIAFDLSKTLAGKKIMPNIDRYNHISSNEDFLTEKDMLTNFKKDLKFAIEKAKIERY